MDLVRNSITADQVKDDATSEVAQILDRCIHCGLCNASCPTYVLQLDERDSPRGRIHLIRSMLESGAAATAAQTLHLDRCLGCRSCATNCPSKVDYGRLLNHARIHMNAGNARSPRARMVRNFLLRVLPDPVRLTKVLRYARFARPVRRMMERAGLREFATMLELAPTGLLPSGDYQGPGLAATKKERKARVILATGCTQQVMRPEINDATIRLLARRGADVEIAPRAGCCGMYATAMGKRDIAIAQARDNIDAWMKLIEAAPVDAIIINASSCGVAVKDYPHLLRDLPDYVEKAKTVAALARDVTEFLDGFDLGPPKRWSSLRIAYHSSCSMRHGQKIDKGPRALLSQAGFAAVNLDRADLCCGAAGGYNMLQPELAARMRDLRIETIDRAKSDFVASTDIGCILHMTAGMQIPVVHVIEVLDWAYGGPVPRGLEDLSKLVSDVPEIAPRRKKRSLFHKDSTAGADGRPAGGDRADGQLSRPKAKKPESV